MEVTWLGQAGFIVEAGGTRCLFDPFLTPKPSRLVDPPFEPEALPPVSAAFISHEHVDHFDADALRRLNAAQPSAAIVVPAPLVEVATGAGVAPDLVIGAVPGDWVLAGSVRYTAVPALHGVTMEDAYSFGPGGRERPRFLGYVVELDGRRLYHAGDTLAWDGHAEELRRLEVEVALLPINGRDAAREAAGIVGNMDAGEAVTLAAAAGARVLVPMHFGMFASNTVDQAIVHAEVERRGVDLAVVMPVLGERRAI